MVTVLWFAFVTRMGLYEVSLVQWTLADGSHPKAYLQEVDLQCRIAKGCQEGYPVLTTLGLTGNLASVEPTSGVHIVAVPSAGLVCYLQPESIVCPLKAAVGEEVETPYGDGKVRHYDAARDMYTVALSWNAMLHVKAEAFDRAGDGVQDGDGNDGVSWLFRFLFFRGREETGRSRSNSVVSGTHSTRSGA